MSSRVSTEIGDVWWVYHPDIHPGHSSPLSLATLPRVGAVRTGVMVWVTAGKNGEFCVALGPVTKTAGILV